MSRISFFAGGAVALIILIDLATGQGPPGLTYIASPPQYEPPPLMQPVGYMPRGEYDLKEGGEYKSDNKDIYKGNSKAEENKLKEDEKKPSVLDNFSSTMSDAWKSLTSLGRSTRSLPTEPRPSPYVPIHTAKVQEAAPRIGPSTARSYDFYDPSISSGRYILIKVDKNLICI